MRGNISIGQYYPVKSPIHSLDPRTKIIATVLYMITVFLMDSFLGYSLIILFTLAVIKLSNVPILKILKGLKAIYFILIFTTILNLFFSQGTTVLYEIGFITITKEGLALAIKTGIRLVLLVSFSSLLTLTTSPIQLTDGIEFLLKPLKVIKVPAHEIAMMMTIALRFIPTLIEEVDKITKAQMARGSSFDTGSLIQKVKSLVPVLVPLFVSSFRRADELAMAMDSKCYRGDINRTRMKIIKYAKIDYIAYATLILAFSCIVYIDNMGISPFGFLA